MQPASAEGPYLYVTQKFFCFGAINNRRNIRWLFPFVVTSDGFIYPNLQTEQPFAGSLYTSDISDTGIISDSK